MTVLSFWADVEQILESIHERLMRRPRQSVDKGVKLFI